MAAYQYYHTAPGWGTNQFRFGAPPAPTFQPQPSWGGLDYYRAHAPTGVSPDLDVYGNAWNRVRDISQDYNPSGGLGVGIHEARHWHRRAYGGLMDLNQLMPEEIGNAAAYEAYRTWFHNSSIYEPLSGEMERQREGLIGLAVAEAMRLLGFTAHQMDPHFRRLTSESAAMTASILFYWHRDHSDDEYRGRSSSYDDPYSYDSDVMYPSRHGRSRSRSRRRSMSSSPFNVGPSMGGSVVGMAPSAMMSTPYVGQPASYGAQPIPYGGHPASYGGQPGSYGGQPGSYGGQTMTYGGQQNPYGSQYGGGGGIPMPMPAGYASSDTAVYGHGPSFPSSNMVMPVQGHRHRSMSMSVPYGASASGYPGAMSGIPQAMPSSAGAPQVVVIKSGKKHHHHGHHSKHRSRSHSRY